MTVTQLVAIGVVLLITAVVINWKWLGKGDDEGGKGSGLVLLVVVTIFGVLLADGISLISTL